MLDSPEINAFALPGGYVYVTRGILAYMESEADMAGVIGHEIGHVTAQHHGPTCARCHRRPDRLPPPLMGEHTEDVLTTLLGYSSEKVTELRKDGCVT